ncbi:CDP-alcohol phosphatidyltransferase family protein [Herpetosiphon giganteus]|uniref:CDP-alcohol phosphatidyltransferase family protein n=1 Tax=Herpetosiphon giganteus TaxID=2029754 RepID=UPI001956BB6C|nr:CDP-alcohol phosphatidyltransferase family protein [Herpetosiphon giganteus]MBM7845291.1 phosphatidylglycerophosphate synthase [Herpetosiphon giganteus]
MVDQFLRQPKERLLAPLAQRLRHIHPTSITLAAFGVGLAAAACAWQQQYWASLGCWLLNRLLDGLDGTVARLSNQQSDLGGYLDILLDVLIYALLPIGLVAGQPTLGNSLAALGLIASFYVNAISWAYLAAILEKRQQGAKAQAAMTSIAMPSGLIEGTETVLLFSLFIVLPSHLNLLFHGMTALVGITIGQRVLWASHYLREEPRHDH